MAKQTARGAIDGLPDPARQAAAEKRGRQRGRSRWLIVGAVIAAFGAVAFFVRRAFAPGVAVDDDEPLGEPHTYPVAGAGTGWPEPQRTREHTETLTHANGADDATPVGAPVPVPPGDESDTAAGGSAPAPPSQVARAGSLAQVEPRGASSMADEEGSAGAPSHARDGTSETPASDDDATMPFPAAPASAAAASVSEAPATPADDAAGDGEPAQPSIPAQRPPVPSTEAQTEVNAQLQLRQDALYAAFPGMTRQDIVECDGELDRLAIILSMRTGTAVEDVRGRIDAILAAQPDGEHA